MQQEVFAQREQILNKIKGKANDLQALYDELATIKPLNNFLFDKLSQADLANYIQGHGNPLQEEKYDSANRLYKLLVSLLGKAQGELVTESGLDENNNAIASKKYRLLHGGHVSYAEVLQGLKESVESKLKSKVANLCFDHGLLRVKENGIHSLGELPDEIKPLVLDKIKIHYQQHEWVDRETQTGAAAVKQLNELDIKHEEIISCYVDAIEIITEGAFCLDTSDYYPGVDLTVRASRMRCGMQGGAAVSLNTSGRDAKEFVYPKAADGAKKRRKNYAEGDSGYDGEFGRDGQHAGNIFIKIDQALENSDLLDKIELCGGNGARGQFGGNGDKGYTGQDGANGRAEDTHGFGGGQTTFGFGKEGSHSGEGGAAGRSGPGGRGGLAGKIILEAAGDKLHEVLQGKISRERGAAGENPDLTASNAPQGGDGGDAPITGMDQVKNKPNFFRQTITENGALDIPFIVEKNPKLREAIKSRQNFGQTGIVGECAATGAVIGAVIPLGIIAGAVVGTLVGLAVDRRLDYKFSLNEQAYRGNPRRNKNTKGKSKQNEKSQYRQENERAEQPVKMVTTLTQHLEQQLSDKRHAMRETRGENHYALAMQQLTLNRESFAAEVEQGKKQELAVDSRLNNYQQEIAAIDREINGYEQAIQGLKQKSTALEQQHNEGLGKLMQLIQTQQSLRDEHSQKNLERAILTMKQREHATSRIEYQRAWQLLKSFLDEHKNSRQQQLQQKRQEQAELTEELAQLNARLAQNRQKLTSYRQQSLALAQEQQWVRDEVVKQTEQQHAQEILYALEGNAPKPRWQKQPLQLSQTKPVLPFFINPQVRLAPVVKQNPHPMDMPFANVLNFLLLPFILVKNHITSSAETPYSKLIGFIEKVNRLCKGRDDLLEVVLGFLMQQDVSARDFSSKLDYAFNALANCNEALTPIKVHRLLPNNLELESPIYTALDHYALFMDMLSASVVQLQNLVVWDEQAYGTVTLYLSHYQQAYRSIAGDKINFAELSRLIGNLEQIIVNASKDERFSQSATKFVQNMQKISLEKLLANISSAHKTQLLRQLKFIADNLAQHSEENLFLQFEQKLFGQLQDWRRTLVNNGLLANLVNDLQAIKQGNLLQKNTLPSDIERLINLIEASRYFSLETCGLELHYNDLTPSVFEQAMLDYNQAPSFELLVKLVREFKQSLRYEAPYRYGQLMGNDSRFLAVLMDNFNYFAGDYIDGEKLAQLKELIMQLPANLESAAITQALRRTIINRLWLDEREKQLKSKELPLTHYRDLHHDLVQSYQAINLVTDPEQLSQGKQDIEQALTTLSPASIKDSQYAIQTVKQKLNLAPIQAPVQNIAVKPLSEDEFISGLLTLIQQKYEDAPAKEIENILLGILDRCNTRPLAQEALASCREQISFILANTSEPRDFYYLLQQVFETHGFGPALINPHNDGIVEEFSKSIAASLKGSQHILFNLHYAYHRLLSAYQIEQGKDLQELNLHQVKLTTIAEKLKDNQDELLQAIKKTCGKQRAELDIVLFKIALRQALQSDQAIKIFLTQHYFNQQTEALQQRTGLMREIIGTDATIAARLIKCAHTQLTQASAVEQVCLLLKEVDFTLLEEPFVELRRFKAYSKLDSVVEEQHAAICQHYSRAMSFILQGLEHKLDDMQGIASALTAALRLLNNDIALTTSQRQDYQDLTIILRRLDTNFERHLGFAKQLQEAKQTDTPQAIDQLLSPQGALLIKNIAAIKEVSFNYQGAVYYFNLAAINNEQEKSFWLDYLYCANTSNTAAEIWQQIKQRSLQALADKKNAISSKQVEVFLERFPQQPAENLLSVINNLNEAEPEKLNEFIYHLQNNAHLFGWQDCKRLEDAISQTRPKFKELAAVLEAITLAIYYDNLQQPFEQAIRKQNDYQAELYALNQGIMADYQKALLATEEKNRPYAKRAAELYLAKLAQFIAATQQRDLNFSVRKAILQRLHVEVSGQNAAAMEKLIAAALNQEVFTAYKKQPNKIPSEGMLSCFNIKPLTFNAGSHKSKAMPIDDFFENGRLLLENIQKLSSHAVKISRAGEESCYDLDWKKRDELPAIKEKLQALYAQQCLHALGQAVRQFNEQANTDRFMTLTKALMGCLKANETQQPLNKEQLSSLHEFLSQYKLLLADMVISEKPDQQTLYDFAQAIDLFIESSIDPALAKADKMLQALEAIAVELKSQLNYKVYKITGYAALEQEWDAFNRTMPANPILSCYQESVQKFQELVGLQDVLALPNRYESMAQIKKVFNKNLANNLLSVDSLNGIKKSLQQKHDQILQIVRPSKKNKLVLKVKPNLQKIIGITPIADNLQNKIRIAIQGMRQADKLDGADFAWLLSRLDENKADNLATLKLALWQHYVDKLFVEKRASLQQAKFDEEVIADIETLLYNATMTLFDIARLDDRDYVFLIKGCEALFDALTKRFSSNGERAAALELILDKLIAKDDLFTQIEQALDAPDSVLQPDELVKKLTLLLKLSPAYFIDKKAPFQILLSKLTQTNPSRQDSELDSLICTSFIYYHELYNQLSDPQEITALARLFANQGYAELYALNDAIETLLSKEASDTQDNDESRIVNYIEESKRIAYFCSLAEKAHVESINKLAPDDKKLLAIFSLPIIAWEEELLALRIELLQTEIWRLLIKSDTDTEASFADGFTKSYTFARDNLAQWLTIIEALAGKLPANTLSSVEFGRVMSCLADFSDLSSVEQIILQQPPAMWCSDILFARLSHHLHALLDVDTALQVSNVLLRLKQRVRVEPFRYQSFLYCLGSKIIEYKEMEQTKIDGALLIELINLATESAAHLDEKLWQTLGLKPLLAWKLPLKKRHLTQKLPFLNALDEQDKQSLLNYLYKISQDKSEAVFKELLLCMGQPKEQLEIAKLSEVLQKVAYGGYELNSSLINQLSDKPIERWEAILSADINGPMVDLSSDELIEIMRAEAGAAKPNAAIQALLHSTVLKNLLANVDNCLACETNSSGICSALKFPVANWQEQDLVQWSKALRGERRTRTDYFDLKGQYLPELMAVLAKATQIYKGFYPRKTQLIALALFLDPSMNNKGRLGNISTGEGKSLITAMLATALALIGEKVDIVTSSKVLAVRDTSDDEREGYQKFFALFGLRSSNNCDDACDAPGTGEDERKQRYKNNDIIYGETGYFQRDILLTQFFGKEIRPRIGDSLIVDEVDNMVIDNAEKTLYISHSITDMRYLREVFIKIWFAVNGRHEQYYSEENVDKIYEYIQKLLEDEELEVPATLRKFVDRELKTWITNAYSAKYMEDNDSYIIGDNESHKQGEVLIMDKDTGVEQMSSRWSQGLHQFLQLKHNGKLSDESLKAVFMSNMSFFKRYQYINGMTGTIGDQAERDILSKEYQVDCFELPRYRKYRFCYEKNKESVCVNEAQWHERIIADINEKMAAEQHTSSVAQPSDKRRAVLIICENVAEVEKLAAKLSKVYEKEKHKIYTYDRAYRKFGQDKLHPGDIVIATNIAGRGTDLGIDKTLEANGGLHVILSYMPANKRVATQAFGRTARAGNKGSGVYLVQDSRKADFMPNLTVDELLDERDVQEQERLEQIVSQSFPKIKVEDRLFAEFEKFKEQIKLKIGLLLAQESNRDVEVSCLELQLQSLQNHWALWLNKMDARLKKVHLTGDELIFTKFQSFQHKISHMLDTQPFGLVIEPAELVKLAKLYLDNKAFTKAEACYDEVIKQHPKFAEIAHYYKAFCIIQLEGGDLAAKRKAKLNLKKALNLLDGRRSTIMLRNQLFSSLNQLTRQRGTGGTVNYFAKQNEGEAQILSQHITAIQQAIGAEVSADNFRSGQITGDEPARLFEALVDVRQDLLKDKRISKKIFIACEILISDFERLEDLLADASLSPQTRHRLKALLVDNKLLTSSEVQNLTAHEAKIEELMPWLQAKHIISARKLYRKDKSEVDEIAFPDVFEYCQEEILIALEQKLSLAQQNQSDYRQRICKESDFAGQVFGREKFLQITQGLVKQRDMVRITVNRDELSGKLDDIQFCGIGAAVKDILLGKRAIQPQVGDRINVLALTAALTAECGLEQPLAHAVKQLLQDKFGESIEIVASLDKDLQQQFITKLQQIIPAKQAESMQSLIEKMLCGQVKLCLTDGDAVSQTTLITAFKACEQNITDDKAIGLLNKLGLQQQVGSSSQPNLKQLVSFKEYYLERQDLAKIKHYLASLAFSNVPDPQLKITQLDLSAIGALQAKEAVIKQKLLEAFASQRLSLTKQDLSLSTQEFDLLKAVLQDHGLSQSNIFNELSAKQSRFKPGLEDCLMRLYEAGGRMTQQELTLRSGHEFSRELWMRLSEAHVVKKPKVNFKFTADPDKRIAAIREQVEQVVTRVFNLTRQSDVGYAIADWTGFGGFVESNNKKLDEYIDGITDALKLAAGMMRTLPKVKIDQKDLKQMFTEGKIPPELMDYVQMSFATVLSLTEDKGFDWDAFYCAMIGVAQIVAGVALDICTCGAAHYFAQGLIAEGIGDIVFAIQSSIQGGFSWKAYCQHKAVSFMLSLATAGVGSYLGKGAQAGKMGIGLATKKALLKAVAKESFVKVATSVINAAVSIGADELSKLMMDELLDKHFINQLNEWLASAPSYKNKKAELEQRFESIYKKFGVEDAQNIINDAIQATLADLQKGDLASAIFDKVSQLVSGLSGAFSRAAGQLGNANNKAALFGLIAKVIDKSVTAASYIKSFTELFQICDKFCDSLDNKLADSFAKRLAKDTAQVEQENNAINIKKRIAQHGEFMQQQMHNALYEKVKSDFVKPGLQSRLGSVVRPLSMALNKRSAKAMQQLREHIGQRAEKHLTIMEHSGQEVSNKLTAKKTRALEQMGHLFSVDKLDPALLNQKVANLGGPSIKELLNQHGDGVKLGMRNGKLHAVVPDYKQYMDHVANGKFAGPMHLKLAAEKLGASIEIVDASNGFKPHKAAPNGGVIGPIHKKEDGGPTFKLAYIEPKKAGEVGHYAPVIEVNGRPKVIDISQDANTQDKCFAQTMLFLQQHQSGKIKAANQAHDYGITKQDINDFNKQLAKLGRGHQGLRQDYHNGLTLKHSELVGGAKVRRGKLKKGGHKSHRLVERKEMLIPMFKNKHQRLRSMLLASNRAVLREHLDKVTQAAEMARTPQQLTEAHGEFNTALSVYNKYSKDPNYHMLTGFSKGVGIDQIWVNRVKKELIFVEAKGPGAKLGHGRDSIGLGAEQMSAAWVSSHLGSAIRDVPEIAGYLKDSSYKYKGLLFEAHKTRTTATQKFEWDYNRVDLTEHLKLR